MGCSDCKGEDDPWVGGSTQAGAGSMEDKNEMVEMLYASRDFMCYVTAPDGTVRSVNPAITSVLGYKKEELIGSNWWTRIHRDDLPRVTAHVAAGREKRPGSAVSVVYRRKHKRGHFMYMRANIMERNGKLFVQELSIDSDHRRQSIMSRNAFVYGNALDLNIPMTVLQSRIDLLGRSVVFEGQAMVVAQAQAAFNVLEMSVTQAFEVAQLPVTEPIRPVLQPVDLGTLLQYCRLLMTGLREERARKPPKDESNSTSTDMPDGTAVPADDNVEESDCGIEIFVTPPELTTRKFMSDFRWLLQILAAYVANAVKRVDGDDEDEDDGGGRSSRSSGRRQRNRTITINVFLHAAPAGTRSGDGGNGGDNEEVSEGSSRSGSGSSDGDNGSGCDSGDAATAVAEHSGSLTMIRFEVEDEGKNTDWEEHDGAAVAAASGGRVGVEGGGQHGILQPSPSLSTTSPYSSGGNGSGSGSSSASGGYSCGYSLDLLGRESRNNSDMGGSHAFAARGNGYVGSTGGGGGGVSGVRGVSGSVSLGGGIEEESDACRFRQTLPFVRYKAKRLGGLCGRVQHSDSGIKGARDRMMSTLIESNGSEGGTAGGENSSRGRGNIFYLEVPYVLQGGGLPSPSTEYSRSGSRNGVLQWGVGYLEERDGARPSIEASGSSASGASGVAASSSSLASSPSSVSSSLAASSSLATMTSSSSSSSSLPSPSPLSVPEPPANLSASSPHPLSGEASSSSSSLTSIPPPPPPPPLAGVSPNQGYDGVDGEKGTDLAKEETAVTTEGMDAVPGGPGGAVSEHGIPPRTALVIDDSGTVRKLLCQTLEHGGMKCDSARNGLEGLHLMQKTLWSMVFIDAFMPVMGGMECIQKFRAWEKIHRKERQYIVVISSFKSGFTENNPEDIDAFLSKPIDMTLLHQLGKLAISSDTRPISQRLPPDLGEVLAAEREKKRLAGSALAR